MANNAIAKARQHKVFCALESTAGTLVFPSDGDLIVPAGYATINQVPSFTDSEEIRDSLDILNRFQDKTPPGEWSVPCYASPSGTLGTPPDEDVLMECFWGLKTVNASTSVVYSPATSKKSFSLWIKLGHTVFFGSGATVSSLSKTPETTGGHKLEFSGKFMKMGWVGTDLIDGAHSTSDTDISVDKAKKYRVGGYVEFVEGSTTYNNSDSGYKITAVNTSTNVVTITPGLETDLDDNSTIQPFLPDGTTVGSPLENRKAIANIDGVDTNIQSMSLNLNSDVQYLEDEITTTGYPEEYAELQRDLSGELSIYHREDDTEWFYDGFNGSQRAIKLTVGDTSGSIVEDSFPYASVSTPTTEPSDPTVALKMSFKALGSSGEDSGSTTYK